METSTTHCVPCEGLASPLSLTNIQSRLAALPEWALCKQNSTIARRFVLSNFRDAWRFADSVAHAAEAEGHHPDLSVGWGYCVVEWSTHSIKGLQINDFVMAAQCDQIFCEKAA